MGTPNLQTMIEQVELMLSEEVLSDNVERAVKMLLNEIEALSADKQSLVEQVARLQKQLEQKKRDKNSPKGDSDQPPKSDSDHSSEEHRKQLTKPDKPPRTGLDRRTFKDIKIHEGMSV